MFKYYVMLCLSSLSLSGMHQDQSIEFVALSNNVQEIVPFKEAQLFPLLAKHLKEAGYSEDGHEKHIYGLDNLVFSAEEKDAFSVLVNIGHWIHKMPYPGMYYPSKLKLQSYSPHHLNLDTTRGMIPNAMLWKIVYYAYQWKEVEPQSITKALLQHVSHREHIQNPALPVGNAWDGTIVGILPVTNGSNKVLGSFTALQWGELSWKKHSSNNDYKDNTTILERYTDRYLLKDHSNNPDAFTKKDLQQFCDDKAIKDILVHHLADTLTPFITITFADNTTKNIRI